MRMYAICWVTPTDRKKGARFTAKRAQMRLSNGMKAVNNIFDDTSWGERSHESAFSAAVLRARVAQPR